MENETYIHKQLPSKSLNERFKLPVKTASSAVINTQHCLPVQPVMFVGKQGREGEGPFFFFFF